MQQLTAEMIGYSTMNYTVTNLRMIDKITKHGHEKLKINIESTLQILEKVCPTK